MPSITDEEWELMNGITSEFHGIRDYHQARKKFLLSLRKIIDYDLADYCLAVNIENFISLVEPIVISRFSKEFEQNFTHLYESRYGALDYTRWFFNNQNSVVYRESDVISNDIRKQTPYYQEYLKPMDLIHVAGISLSSEGISYGVIAFYRRSHKSDFSDHDLLLLEKLVPHLISRMKLEYDNRTQEQHPYTHFSYLRSNYGVSKREEELSNLILLGKSNKEIGNILSITENTVKKHVGHLLQKLQVSNRVQLVHKINEEIHDDSTIHSI